MRLILRRLGWLVPLLVALSLLVFALAELSPADASSAFLGSQDEFTSGAGRQGVEQAIAHGLTAVVLDPRPAGAP